MRFSIPAVLVGVFIENCLGGALQVIDEDHECKIYSSDHHDCFGYSASFAKLNRDDCSEMSQVVNGTRIEYSYIDVAACGQANGINVAWILVNQTGEVTFFNKNGDKAECLLDNGLKTGSLCNTSDPEPLTSTSASPSSSAPATSTPSSSSIVSNSSDTGSSMSTCSCA
ncbi:hypothetical protein N7532_009306 [Penicillium argentinense]|uniref:Secreted protein n=1 Tax=Penicillium argentinense TaxID=1131581 RepID=A0A9W9EZ48_9EURO|nr:uncharacterized protein N7532_009306 [Penicillium argentinense]KAJ5090622.1 hypothetical protein N7532_009306 [Penicillium argentinense]